jgi:hypothetical protein
LVPGYKLRTHIAKALKRRSEAIRKSLARYNEQAAKLKPPRPSLTWKEIVEYSFLGEFDLLRNSRSDVREELWTQPARREATVKFYKLCRAREELVQLNVEIPRLRTSIHDETLHTNKVISDLSLTNPALCSELHRRWKIRSSVNMRHLSRLDKIERSVGFTGKQGLIGVRLGMTPTSPIHPPSPILPAPASGNIHNNENDVDSDVDEDGRNDLETVTDIVLCITD